MKKLVMLVLVLLVAVFSFSKIEAEAATVEETKIMEQIQQFRLFDDNFMTKCFEDNIECTELVLQIIMEKSDLKVTEARTQYTIKNLQGRSIRLDVDAVDSKGKKYNIEVQRADKGAGEKCARYNSSLIDANILLAGDDTKNLPETYVIFITENDVMGKEKGLYHIQRTILETGEKFEDGSHIIYVNGSYRDDSPLGLLMKDFSCRNAEDMHYKVLADRVRYFKKDKKGVGIMCKAVEDLYKEELIKNKYVGYVYLKLNDDFMLQAGVYELNTGMSLEEIIDKLGSGKVVDNSISVTFIEGKRITNYVKVISENFGYSEEEILKVISDETYLKELIDKYWFLTEDILDDRLYYALEGYLSPNTYFFDQNASIKDIIEKMLDTTAVELKEYKDDIDNSKYSVHEMVTMASIVELEGSNSDDRRGVAGVFYNRLQNGWSLGSDVTTYYAEQIEMNDRDLYQKELIPPETITMTHREALEQYIDNLKSMPDFLLENCHSIVITNEDLNKKFNTFKTIALVSSSDNFKKPKYKYSFISSGVSFLTVTPGLDTFCPLFVTVISFSSNTPSLLMSFG